MKCTNREKAIFVHRNVQVCKKQEIFIKLSFFFFWVKPLSYRSVKSAYN